jgi:HEAT repeat protein
VNKCSAVLLVGVLCSLPAAAEDGRLKDLKKGKAAERAAAASDLGEHKVYAAIPDLILALSQDKDEYVRSNAASALWAMADHASSARAALKEALNDPYDRVRVNAAGALWRLETPKPQLTPALEGVVAKGSASDAAEAADLLISMGRTPKEFVPVLMRVMGGSDLELKKTILGNIKEQKKDPGYIPVLLKGLGDRDPGIRSTSASWLGDEMYATREVFSALKQAASDKDESVRSSVAWSMTDMGAKAVAKNGLVDDAVALLLTQLHDKNADVRKAAANSLRRIDKRTPEVIAALRAGLKDKDPDAAGAARDALISMDEKVPPSKE